MISMSSPKMLCYQSQFHQKSTSRKPLKIRLSNTPQINLFQMAALNPRKYKKFQPINKSIKTKLIEDNNAWFERPSTKKDRSKENSPIKSSYQMYKERQKQQKQKLQLSQSIEKPKTLSDHFYCTLRIKQRKFIKRQENPNNCISINLGNINTIKSQIHQREDLMKTIRTMTSTTRQYKTQCAKRERKYSIKQVRNIRKDPIYRTHSFRVENDEIDLQKACRPWSPEKYEEYLDFN